MHKYLLYFFVLCGSVITVSCNKEKLKAPNASFLVVDQVTLKTLFNQGTNSHKITDIWYYVNDQFKGIFPVGSVMPIVANDNADIKLYAGIKNNGISATRIPYPFFKAISFNQIIEPGKTYTISPQFEYNTNTIFAYTQNFDLSGSQFTSVGDSAYSRITDPAKTFGGFGGSIFMSMNAAKPTSEMIQTTPYYLPTGGAAVYLELNYKCNQSISVGVLGGGYDERPAITLNRTTDWNKIYIQLTSVISTQPTYSGYQVFIKAKREVNTPEIYIDNIKLITQ